jgi:bifunctional DNA-binding transcriptional regulator/antitoxin component of YhaV-PrlF toxin-antitoxin module
MPQIVYILTNPSMPDLIKIGKTGNLKERLRSLNSGTGVPEKFLVHYACEVADNSLIEKTLHYAFGEVRTNPKKEFFRKDPERVVAILRLFAIREITIDNKEIVESSQELMELEKVLTKKRDNFSFEKVGIRVGSELEFTRDSEIKAIVAKNNKVVFCDEIMSISNAAKLVLGVDYSIQGPAYWKYNDKTLNEIRNEEGLLKN